MTLRARLCFFLILLCPVTAFADAHYAELDKTRSQVLQRGLEDILQKRELTPFVQAKTLAIVIADISDLSAVQFAEVNGDHMMYAASLPKLAILVAAFVEIERGQLDLDDTLWQDMNRMIRHSDNKAANRVLDRVGRDRLLAIIQEPDYHFYDRNDHGGLWVGKNYSADEAYQRDPLMNLSHGATAVQAARVYYLLASGQLLRPDLSHKMLEVLSEPAIAHKLVNGLRESYPDAKIYRKSGTWHNFHADSAMIEFQGRRYILAILVDNPRGGEWISSLATPLMKLLERAASEG